LRGHAKAVNCLAFGRLPTLGEQPQVTSTVPGEATPTTRAVPVLVSGSDDGTIRLWDVGTQHLVWATRSTKQQLEAQGLHLEDAKGLQPYHIALLTHHGYKH
jgi:WD40 repeat protein